MRSFTLKERRSDWKKREVRNTCGSVSHVYRLTSSNGEGEEKRERGRGERREYTDILMSHPGNSTRKRSEKKRNCPMCLDVTWAHEAERTPTNQHFIPFMLH
jgi:hypothetical protein